MFRQADCVRVPQSAVHESFSTYLTQLRTNDARTLLNTAAPPGDYDGDRDVDRADYNLWKSTFGTSRIFFGSGADGNLDGLVNAADYTVWRNSKSGINSIASGYATPKPFTANLILVAAAMLTATRYRTRNQ